MAGCTENVPDPDGVPLPPPTLQPLQAGVVVPGSMLPLVGSGFLTPPAGQTIIRLRGEMAGAPLEVDIRPTELTATALRVPLTLDRLTGGGMPAEGGLFRGVAQVRVSPADQDAVLTAEAPVSFEFKRGLEPTLEEVLPGEVFPGAILRVNGDGLISDGEGQSFLMLTGRFDGPGEVGWDLREAALPLTQRAGRREGAFYLKPRLMSLAPGRFEGQARLVTESVGGTRRESAPLDGIVLVQGLPEVRALTPMEATRGQIITLEGRGFLPNDPVERTATLITAEGVFEYDDGRPALSLEGPAAYRIIPEAWVDHTEIRAALHTQRHPVSGELVGLGPIPGVFTGTLTVSLFAGLDRVDAEPIPARLRIGPMVQRVWLRYLPGFSEGLRRFGMTWAEAEIRQRILEVCRRDFAGFRVEFSEVRPTDWAEYVTVEIGGRDPNNLGLFGLENTLEKDVGNSSLSEVIGGVNAETAAAGIVAYGGVFVESFMTLSPGHPQRAVIASPRFDDIFGPFSPALSPEAVPMTRDDLAGGPRLEAALEAVRVLGNLVGTTITHEVGHTLGLASVDGDVHNPVDTDGGLMDRGEFRSFAERAELDGEGPSRFMGANRVYLLNLLGEAP